MPYGETEMETQDPSEAWRALLQSPDLYDHRCASKSDLRRIKRLGFVWWRILRAARLRPGARVFEMGCGGGKHLASLASNGFVVDGVDVSPDVVDRARIYLSSVAKFCSLEARVEVANFLEYDATARAATYDLCFHAGVVEHFLDAEQRALIWSKLATMTRPGGWVVSIVPCGKHVLRERCRRERLMGYNVPEIDYGCALHEQELRSAGLTRVKCMAHNFLAFLPAHPNPVLAGRARKILILGANATLPWLRVPEDWKERLASTLIVMGQRPA
jgi:2-polyprenyl-3-methyl-5-hydroxy-6-metoxy-1,4-benzoquinol methylase